MLIIATLLRGLRRFRCDYVSAAGANPLGAQSLARSNATEWLLLPRKPFRNVFGLVIPAGVVMTIHDIINDCNDDIAAIAQLGERQTEDLKVPGSIPGLGTSSLVLSWLWTWKTPEQPSD